MLLLSAKLTKGKQVIGVNPALEAKVRHGESLIFQMHEKVRLSCFLGGIQCGTRLQRGRDKQLFGRAQLLEEAGWLQGVTASRDFRDAKYPIPILFNACATVF